MQAGKTFDPVLTKALQMGEETKRAGKKATPKTLGQTEETTRYFRLREDYQIVVDKLSEKGISVKKDHMGDHYRVVVSEKDFPDARFILQQLCNPHKKTKILQLKQMYRD